MINDANYFPLANLPHLGTPQFLEAFNLIPKKCNQLSLANNELGKRRIDELCRAAPKMPETLLSLNLSGNELIKLKDEDLAEFFKALPVTLTELDISNNGFDQLSAKSLALILRALPSGLKKLTLGPNVLSARPFSADYRTTAELRQIAAAFQGLIAEIILSKPAPDKPDFIQDEDTQDQGANDDGEPTAEVVQEPAPKNSLSIELYKAGLDIVFDLRLDYSLLRITEKMNQFTADENHEALEAATKLRSSLIEYREDFLNSAEPLKVKIDVFRCKCVHAIEDSRTVLETHRGGRELLGDLARFFIAICTLGMLKYKRGECIFGFFSTNTDSGDKLKELESTFELTKLYKSAGLTGV